MKTKKVNLWIRKDILKAGSKPGWYQCRLEESYDMEEMLMEGFTLISADFPVEERKIEITESQLDKALAKMIKDRVSRVDLPHYLTLELFGEEK